MWKCNTINVYMTWLQKEDIFHVLEKLIRELHQLLTWDLHERLLCVTHKNYCREQCCRGSNKHEQDVRVCCEPEKLKVTLLSRAVLSYCALSIKKNPGWYPGWLQLCYRYSVANIHLHFWVCCFYACRSFCTSGNLEQVSLKVPDLLREIHISSYLFGMFCSVIPIASYIKLHKETHSIGSWVWFML